jgi:hypothetical protein
VGIARDSGGGPEVSSEDAEKQREAA